MLTTFQLHCTSLNIHGKVLQIHRAGQNESEPTMGDKNSEVWRAETENYLNSWV